MTGTWTGDLNLYIQYDNGGMNKAVFDKDTIDDFYWIEIIIMIFLILFRFMFRIIWKKKKGVL